MYARSTTIMAAPTSIDDGITNLRDRVMPALMDLPGCIGLSLLVDRESGRCIATTSWESAETMRSSSATVQQLREQGTMAFGGMIEGVQEWEIGLLHRAHETRPGSWARVTWLRGEPGTVDAGLALIRDSVLPQLEQLDGFCSASAMVDRSTGRLVGAFAFDSREAVERSRDTATRVRTATAGSLGAQIEDVHEFELALAHLRVPELV